MFSIDYHPQTQSVVERMNSLAGPMLRSVIPEENDPYGVCLLQFIDLVIKALPNTGAGYSPLFLDFGSHATVPVDLVKGN